MVDIQTIRHWLRGTGHTAKVWKDEEHSRASRAPAWRWEIKNKAGEVVETDYFYATRTDARTELAQAVADLLKELRAKADEFGATK